MPVTVLFPTYRNADVFDFSLSSVLGQSYEDLEVFVYDNGLADGYAEVRNVVKSNGDKRIHYRPNRTNIGAARNYFQLFQHAATAERSIILAADSGLRADAVDRMLDIQDFYDASWVRPRAVGLPLGEVERSKDLFSIPRATSEPHVAVVNSWEVLRRFFSEENIDGEFDTASWAGALIDQEVWKMAVIEPVPFKWHGLEQYVAMSLLLAKFRFAFLDMPLEVAVQGAVRYGTERPPGDYTRLETIQATHRIICRNRSAVLEAVPAALAHQRRALIRFLTLRKGYRLRACYLLSYASFTIFKKNFPKRFC